MATKALAYLRVSGKGQIEGDGFDRQADTIARYAKAHGIEVIETYREEGVSGTRELDNRPALAAVLDRIQSNGVRTVLVERADRLARDLMVSEVILGQFRDLGVAVIAADGAGELTVGDDDPTRKLIRQVLGAVAEFDKSVTVLKLRAARARIRRTKGRCEGRKPFGDRAGEAATIERIRQLHRKPKGADRMSYAQIAATLNAEGRPTRTGGAWKPGTVFSLVKRLQS